MFHSFIDRPLLLGHRGSPRAYPENSLTGFQAALDAGLDGVELDVRRLKDGALVVCHDPHLQDGRKLSEVETSELPHTDRQDVPLLRDVLAWATGNGAYLNIEIKPEAGKGDGRTEETLDLARAYGLSERVIVSSFSPLQLQAALRHAPDIARGFLYHRSYHVGCDLIPVVARQLQVTALHPHHSLVTPELMQQAAQENWIVNAWTVNDRQLAASLVGLGVNGLIGDIPEELLATEVGF